MSTIQYCKTAGWSLLAAGIIGVSALSVQAAPVNPAPITGDFTAIGGNASPTLNPHGDDKDCPGAYGSSFGKCVLDGSPVIAKFEYDDGVFSGSEINSAFSQVLATMFTINPGGSNGSGGSWTYDPCPTCPGITAFTVKAGAGPSGGGYFTYLKDSEAFVGLGDTYSEWLTPANKYLSHITFYDSSSPIPLPAAVWLLLGGLGGLGLVGRRRKTSPA